MPIPKSESWRCYRCGTTLPSPRNGESPVACIKELGGCGRIVDIAKEHFHTELADDIDPADACDVCKVGTTRFFPSDWSEAKCDLYVQSDTSEGGILFRQTVSHLEHYFIFPEPAQSRIAALFVFQSYLARPILPSVFHIGFGGPMSSGKTTLLEILKELCWEGIMSGDVSVPALTRLLDHGCTLFIDEADEIEDDKRDLIYGSARRGYRRGSTRIVSIQNGKAWDPQVINIYGCYAFSFYNDMDVDAALLSRMAKFDVPRLSTDKTKERVFLNMARTVLGKSDLGNRIKAYIDSRAKEWTPEKAAAHLLEPGFEERTTKLTGVTDLSRDTEIAGIMLLISDIIEIDIVEELKTVFTQEARSAVDEGVLEALEDVKDIFMAKFGERVLDERMRFEDLRHGYNDRRKQYGDKGLSPPEFKSLLGRLGFIRGNGLIHPKNRSYVVWTLTVEQKLTSQTSPVPETSLTRYFGGLGDKIRVRSQEDKVRVLLDRGLGKEGEKQGFGHVPENGLTQDEIWTRLKDVDGFPEDELGKLLDHLSQQRLVYQPTQGKWKRV